MPSSIPFDHPSLVLGNIVNPLILGKLKGISVLQAQIDAAQDKMNSYISMKRSIGMTINEMININVDVSSLVEKIKDIDTSIVQAAAGYISVRLNNETSIQELKEQIGEIEPENSTESPVDFNKTEIKKLPLSAESIKLDAQYFSYDENNEENPLGTIASIENYIKESTSTLGPKVSTELTSSASSQINLQRKNHSLSGTLIITATCTHRNAILLAPCVIDVDKAISVWNTLNPNNKINTTDLEYMQNLSEQDNNNDTISILSGATYGSSFVGMVHVLKQDLTGNNGPSMTQIAASLQERLTVGSWLEESSGGFGVAPSFSDDIKNLLSTQKISSHVTIVVMGCVPSVRSNQLQLGVKTFADFDSTKLTASLAAISNATSSEKSTVDQAASAAKTGNRILAMQGSTIQNVMMGLGKIDQGANKIMDINSMMTAFEDYLQEVKKGDSGVPINYSIKNLSQRQLAQLWMEKYYPKNSQVVTAKENQSLASSLPGGDKKGNS